jgi:hypothetical protein
MLFRFRTTCQQIDVELDAVIWGLWRRMRKCKYYSLHRGIDFFEMKKAFNVRTCVCAIQLLLPGIRTPALAMDTRWVIDNGKLFKRLLRVAALEMQSPVCRSRTKSQVVFWTGNAKVRST